MQCNGSCNGNSLQLASGQLMGIFVKIFLTEINTFQGIIRHLSGFFFTLLFEMDPGLHQKSTDLHSRTEYIGRILKNHLGAADMTAHLSRHMLLHSKDCLGKRRLSAAALTDQTETFSLIHIKTDMFYRILFFFLFENRIGSVFIIYRQIFYCKNRCIALFLYGNPRL